MFEITIKAETEEEYKKIKDIAAMIVTAKAHGWADVLIMIRKHELTEGHIDLQTKW